MDASTALAVENQRFGRPPHGRTARVVTCALLALAPVATAAALAASNATSHPARVALGRALIVAIPIAVGLYAWYARSDTRFGLLLAVTGAACFFTTLAESHEELPYTVGRLAGWLVEVLLAYVILSFPTGRLVSRTDRILTAAMGLVVLALFVPRLALVEHFEVPSPYTSCTSRCPANAFFALGHEPAAVASSMRVLGALAVFAVMTGVILRVRGRIAAATPLARRVLIPVLAVALVRLGLLGVGIVARAIDPTLPALRVVAWLLALAVPALALAFLGGLLSWRVYAAGALQRLARSLGGAGDAATLRQALGEALSDPSIQLAFPAPGTGGGSVDSRGKPFVLPPSGGGRAVTEVRRRGSVVAWLIHDDALSADSALLDASVSIAGVAIDNERLVAQSETAGREMRNSRARIAAGAERERRRIERDLHDGAQQRLVALRIELELAQDLVRSDPELGLARLGELGDQLDDALDELRSLAHGVYPPLLADRGLAEALRAAAARSTVPVVLEVHGLRRYSPEIEGAVYFCVLEALQNVLKHAVGVHRVVVSLDGTSRVALRFGVRDDGGGPREGVITPGGGITNMRDRMAAIGGQLDVTSAPRVGTSVRAWLPTPSVP